MAGEGRPQARSGEATLVGGQVPAVCRRDVTMARRPKPAKIEPVVTSKIASGRPLLTESARQTEFNATHSKQTTKKFLTEARTHIRIFSFRPFTTQNPAQLIQRRRYPTNPRRSKGRAPSRISNRFWIKNRSHRKQTIKPCLAGSRFACSAQRATWRSVLWARRGRDTMDIQTITRLSPGGSPQ